jgi:multidrug efflux pump subunit AcrA (membrane-fusion protein)
MFERLRKLYQQRPIHTILGALILTLLVGYQFNSSISNTPQPTFQVQKGDLDITVYTSGELLALNSTEVRNELSRGTKIISIIPEGTSITQEDIKNGKIILELDEADLQDQLLKQTFQVDLAQSSLIDAEETLRDQDSTLNERVKSIKESIIFSLLDLEKLLGRVLANNILNNASLPASVDEIDTLAKQITEQQSKPATSPKINSIDYNQLEEALTHRINYQTYLETDKKREGEAIEKLNELEKEYQLKKTEFNVIKEKYEASVRLSEKNYLTKSQLNTDLVSLEKISIALSTAESDLRIYRKYEFPRLCMKMLNEYQENINKLINLMQENRSKVVLASSKYQSAKNRYEIESANMKKLEQEIASCKIKATAPGLVIYGDSSKSKKSTSTTIEEGASIIVRQTILTIPDLSQFYLSCFLHESQLNKVKKGQTVEVTVDVKQDITIQGTIYEIGVLPNPAMARMAANYKMYQCKILLSESPQWIKPGMSAQAKIIVEHLKDVIYTPIQSISAEPNRTFCQVQTSTGTTEREVKVGSYNESFVHIIEGLEPGETVITAGTGPINSSQPDNSAKSPKKRKKTATTQEP